MTQIELAKNNIISEEMRKVAEYEGMDPEIIKEEVKKGEIVILKNVKHNVNPVGIGKNLKVKINANIGTSEDYCNIDEEIEKLKTAIKYGADTVMDLSVGGDLDKIRREILKESTVPVGTVPIYQAAKEAAKRKKGIVNMSIDEIFETIQKHAEDGVDFITVHCGITIKTLRLLKKQGRFMDIVSRGGAFLAEWMVYNRRENPLYEHFDKLLKIAKRYNLTLSLGDALRPGSILDATDLPQIEELITLGELTIYARKEGVSVMIEGPGHVPIDQIEENIKIEKELCQNAPFYVLGPLVTDAALGYDHIASAIGGAIAAFYGADFLCYVTPSEHLRLPTVSDVKEGVIAAKIAAHAVNIVRGKDIEKDKIISEARKKFDWETQIRNAFDPEKAEKLRMERPPKKDFSVCTMCGEYCAIKEIGGIFESDFLN